MASPLPVVGASGIFEVSAPFNTKVNPQIAYECISISTFGKLQSLGKDPFRLIYEPAGIDYDTYETDAKSAVKIVTLKSSSGQQIDIPSSYILSCPLAGGVPYNVMGIVAKIGALPDEVPLDVVSEKVGDLIKANVGLTPEMKIVKLSQTSLIPTQEHEDLENSRLALITDNNTLTAEINALKDENERLRQQIELLTEYIQDHP